MISECMYYHLPVCRRFLFFPQPACDIVCLYLFFLFRFVYIKSEPLHWEVMKREQVRIAGLGKAARAVTSEMD